MDSGKVTQGQDTEGGQHRKEQKLADHANTLKGRGGWRSSRTSEAGVHLGLITTGSAQSQSKAPMLVQQEEHSPSSFQA